MNDIISTSSYAASKVKSIREANASEFALGKCAVKIDRMLEDLPRIQEMNQELTNARRPGQDLAKDVKSFQVPAIKDKHIVDILADKEQDR